MVKWAVVLVVAARATAEAGLAEVAEVAVPTRVGMAVEVVEMAATAVATVGMTVLVGSRVVMAAEN